jgi:hypothetical protein
MMPGREYSRAERLARCLIRYACSRLPRETSDDRCREWTAELHAIVHDPEIPSRARRHLRGLLYAADQSRGAWHLGRRPGPALRVYAGKLWRMQTPSGYRLVSALLMLTFLAGDWAVTPDRADFAMTAVTWVVLWAIGFFRRRDATSPAFLPGPAETGKKRSSGRGDTDGPGR